MDMNTNNVKVIADAKYELTRQPNKWGIPIMKISLLNEEAKTIRKGYLMPFRRECFRACENIEGEGNLGSSCVTGLDGIIELYADYVEFETMARYAIYDFLKNALTNCEGEIIAKRIDFSESFNNKDTFGKFIEDSMKWILDEDDLSRVVYYKPDWSEERVAYCDE